MTDFTLNPEGFMHTLRTVSSEFGTMEARGDSVDREADALAGLAKHGGLAEALRWAVDEVVSSVVLGAETRARDVVQKGLDVHNEYVHADLSMSDLAEGARR